MLFRLYRKEYNKMNEDCDEEENENYSIQFYKSAYDNILKKTKNKGTTLFDIEYANDVFYERYNIYGYYINNYNDEGSAFYVSYNRPYRDKFGCLTFNKDMEYL